MSDMQKIYVTYNYCFSTGSGRPVFSLTNSPCLPKVLPLLFPSRLNHFSGSSAILSVKSRLSLGRVSRRLYCFMQGEVCWKGLDRLCIIVREGGWWFQVNGCVVRGSRKEPHVLIRGMVPQKHVVANVCEALQAMAARIRVRKIYLDDVASLRNKDILRTLGRLMSVREKHDVHSLKMVVRYPHPNLFNRLPNASAGHLPYRVFWLNSLLFEIFQPLASSITKFTFHVFPFDRDIFSAPYDRRGLVPRFMMDVVPFLCPFESFWKLVKLCVNLNTFHLSPYIGQHAGRLDSLEGKPITRILIGTYSEQEIEELRRVMRSLPNAILELRVFSGSFGDGDTSQLREIELGTYSGTDNHLARARQTLVTLSSPAYPSLTDINLWFGQVIEGSDLGTLTTSLLNSLLQREERNNRSISFNVFCSQENESIGYQTKRWQSMAEKLEEEQVHVQPRYTHKPQKVKRIGLVQYEQFVTIYVLTKETVTVRLYCDFLPNYFK